MSLKDTFVAFEIDINQCDNLISHAHLTASDGSFLFSEIDRKQITAAAFLNMFVAWESFLEAALIAYMTGETSETGVSPIRYVFPPDKESARLMIVGANRYFDYSNPDSVKKIALLFFKNGVPFEPHISSIASELHDLKTMRNSAAHITSTTQKALESLVTRVLGNPKPGIHLYELLLTTLPISSLNDTVFSFYKTILVTAAKLISE
ncbi:MAG TPA: hypothetical protein ENN47_05875 [Mesotoga infera]|uniref:RiboL-PSP-HEPN domain-containing protein n=1 Tax=Mesotoga infera TaxID=1236046 RepID=A0A7C1GSI1_9BACT|nr:hypothetical protein [Mesotoga infera]